MLRSFLVCCLLYCVSLFFVNRLPGTSALLSVLGKEPVQTPASVAPFAVTVKGITYTVTPLFGYEIYGMAATYHHSDSLIDISHRQWKDNLNFADLSLLWGHNALSGVYRKVKFYHADWTGYYQYSGNIDFRSNGFSNNHILSNDAAIRRAVLATRPGDQVYIKGYLAAYSHSNGRFTRGTSTVRDDTGNGACETIYVTDYRVLRQANAFWRGVHTLSWYAGLCLLFLLGYRFFA